MRIRYNGPPDMRPNPYIRPWGSPPWETPDIWIDSERNGWGNYRYTSGGEPVGNGDDAWVNHDNRLYVRVTNEGPGTATNVRVEVFVNSPPGMGDRGASWDYLGTIGFLSIGPGATAQDFVIWKPTVGEHTCVKAVILDVPNEVRTTDNLAQENVSVFDTTRGSPYKPVGLEIRVNNPFEDAETPVRFHVRNVPEGWGVLIEPPRMLLRPGAHDFVTFMVFPSGFDPKRQDDRYQPGFLGRPMIEAQVPYADTFIPIGGVEVWTHLVTPTTLDCAIGRLPEPRLTAPARQNAGLLDRNAKPVPQKIADIQRATVEGGLIRPEPRPVFILARGEVVVTGRLTPAVINRLIAVELTRGEKRVFQLVPTFENGVYRATFKGVGPGLWDARAYFDGDETHAKAESPSCRVQLR